MRLVNISEGWLQRVSVCVSVSDREILSKPLNEMRVGRPATHTHTLHLSPPLFSSGGSRSSVIWWIGQGSRLCVFTWNPSCGNSSPVFLFTSIPLSFSLSFFLSFFSLSVCSRSCYLQFQFHSTYNIFITAGSSTAEHQHDKNQHLLWILFRYCSSNAFIVSLFYKMYFFSTSSVNWTT